MMKTKRFKRIIVLSDCEDSSDDEDFHQTHPRKKPIPRSPSLNTTSGLNSCSSPSKPDLKVITSDSDSDDTTSSDDDIILISNNEESNGRETSSNENNEPSDSEECSDTEESMPMCQIPGCFLEDIISPSSIYVTNFQETKKELAEELYHLYNITIFGNQLPEKANIVWNKRLKTTAGRCHHMLNMKTKQRLSMTHLSDKFLDSAERLRSTLAHEMCHAACWTIDGLLKDHHGPLWQDYAKSIKHIHPELPEVTQYHYYIIKYNFYYQCSLRDKRFGRYREITKNKCYCSRCGGRLHPLATT
ncbi:germ cell nuclear acidic protein-like [Ranitomeya variabilis]|uniref:germ cell nuclear acidic protein-like n=1 Tax=Ranitomeya variabilis TaxID=490064 RepID=UPI0040578BBD